MRPFDLTSPCMYLAMTPAAVALCLGACSNKKPAGPPPPQVATLTVEPRPATLTADYVAQIEAVNTVVIQPRAGGALEKQVPTEGEQVKTGELLFVIDPQPYIVALAQAKAALAQDEAQLEKSQRDLARAQSLAKIDAISQQDLDSDIATNKANIASVDSAKASVKTAELNLGYTTITSPIDGVMGRAQVRLGSLVVASSTTLTTLYQTDRMYVNMRVTRRPSREQRSSVLSDNPRPAALALPPDVGAAEHGATPVTDLEY